MFGSDILEVAIGMAFVFLLASLVCTAVKEGIESLLNKRAEFMRRAIEKMLSGDVEPKAEVGKAVIQNPRNGDSGTTVQAQADTHTKKRVSEFYKHPLIQCLCSGEYQSSSHRNLPGYIPSSSFSRAVIELICKEKESSLGNNGISNPIMTGAQLQEVLQGLPDGPFKVRLITLLKDSQTNLSAAKATLEQWFNQSMEQVGNYYKVHSQELILVIATFVTFSLNINAVTIAQRLVTDTALRKALVAQAETEAKKLPPADPKAPNEGATPSTNSISTGTNPPVTTRQPSEANTDSQSKGGKRSEDPIEQIKKLGLPIGWGAFKQPDTQLDCLSWVGEWLSLIAGWLVTIFAISLGAPFWFDTLNRIIQVRAALKPKADKAEPA